MKSIETTPKTISDIAASMGMTRQGIQRIADEMKREGLIEYQPNPRHRRAYLVGLTKPGEKMLDRMERAQLKWIRGIGSEVRPQGLAQCNETLSVIRRLLEFDGMGNKE